MFFSLTVDYTALDKGGVIRRGESSNHFEVANTTNSLNIRIAKRNFYPRTFCNEDSHGNIILGYGVSNSVDTESLTVTINPSGEIEIQRDAYITLPLYYYSTDSSLFMSNDYEEVVAHITNPAVNLSRLAEALMPGNHRTGTTLIDNVSVLGERQILRINHSGSELILPHDRSWLLSKDAQYSDPHKFRAFFDTRLDMFTDTRFKNETYAFQASGGLDSSTLPLHISTTNHPGGALSHIRFPSKLSAFHYHKLESLSSFTGYPILVTEYAEPDDLPLVTSIRTLRFSPFPSTGEMSHATILAKQARELANEGITVLTMGIGCDDIFENIVDPQLHFMYGELEIKRRQLQVLPPYLTQKFRRLYVDSTPALLDIPLSSLPSSSNAAITSIGNAYIESGIWPVSPFLDPELYKFCQGLPAHLRANKNILRAYYQANQFPMEIYNSLKQEEMSFIERSILLDIYLPVIQMIIEHAITVKLGYVDSDVLLGTLELIRSGDIEAKEWLWHIYQWVGTEINLQASRVEI
jgi:hypothetical protein